MGLFVNAPDARGYGGGGKGGKQNSVHELGGYHTRDGSGIEVAEPQVPFLERGGRDSLTH